MIRASSALERALKTTRKRNASTPGNALTHGNIAFTLAGLNRLAEAKTVADETMAVFPANTLAHLVRLHVACLERDTAKKEELLALGRKRMVEILQTAFHCAVRDGRIADARAFQQEAAQMYGEARPDPRGRLLIEMGFAEWRAWDTPIVHARWPPRQTDFADHRPAVSSSGALRGRAMALVPERFSTRCRRSPAGVYLALSRAWVEATLALARKDPQTAIDHLRPMQRFEGRWGDVTLLRAKAQLLAGNTAAAMADFKRIVDRPPPGPAVTVYPWALIGLARARVAAGDASGAKAAHDQFLGLWAGADADLPLLAEARRERAALKRICCARPVVSSP